VRPIYKISDVSPGSVKRVDVEGLPPLAAYDLAGRFYVTDDTCAHGKASLSEGYVHGAVIECPWHGGRFDIASGTPACLPAVEPIATYAVAVVGDDVCIGD
jgi:nitrite reductase/ring-hydroxylating ferredoxin subunit